MEDHAEHPAHHADIAESNIVDLQWIVGWDPVSDFREAIPMCQEIEEGEEDRARFLHAQKAVEGPFAMVLENRIEHRRISRDATVCDDLLADIVAIGGTRPECKTQLERWGILISSTLGSRNRLHAYEEQSHRADNSHRHKSKPVSNHI